MSFFNQVSSSSNTRLNGKSTLNPNATEFIPLFPTTTATTLSGASRAIEATIAPPQQSRRNAVLDFDRTKSSASINSDEEARQYWGFQLPDDITPDFNDEELKGVSNISLEGLSLDDGTEGLRIASSTKPRFLLDQLQDFLPIDYEDSTSFSTSLTTHVSFGARLSSLNANAKAWEAPTSKNKLLVDRSSNRPHPYRGGVGDFVDDILSESGMVDSNEIDSLAFLANQFPGFSYESLAEVFFANQHDLNSTVEMLTHLEHQVEGGSNKVANSKSSSALNPNAPVFHSRAVHEARNSRHISPTDGLLQTIDPYQPPDRDRWLLLSPTSSIPTQVTVGFDPGMENSSLQKSNSRKYEGDGSIHMGIGSSKTPGLPAPYITRVSSFQGKVTSPSSANRTSFGCGYGQAVGNVHPELREDIRQHGGLLNTYLQQAHPSFSMANKSPAKEMKFEVPLHSMVAKPVHLESKISRSNTRREERMIDVHDLHVTDAIHVLSHELNTIRSAARASEQSLPVCICVGSEHLTRGPFTPGKLPAAVRRYLLEEERLDYSELQPGLLRVVIC